MKTKRKAEWLTRAVLKDFTRLPKFEWPDKLYVGLHSGFPGLDAASNEIKRRRIRMKQAADGEFTASPPSSVTGATHYTIWDSAKGGNCIAYGALHHSGHADFKFKWVDLFDDKNAAKPSQIESELFKKYNGLPSNHFSDWLRAQISVRPSMGWRGTNEGRETFISHATWVKTYFREWAIETGLPPSMWNSVLRDYMQD